MTPLYDRDGWIWLDGEWLPWRDAMTHLLTHSLHYGMGCFEGVRAYSGASGTQLFRAEAHTRRLVESAHILDIPLSFNSEALIEAQRQCLVRNELKDAYLKPTIFLGAEGLGLRAKGLTTHVMVAAWDLGAYITPEAASVGLRAITASWSRHHVNVTACRAKTNGNYVNSIMALNSAVKAGFDETLMLDTEGYVAEASAANVFMLRDGVLHTPPTTSCLQGITRDSVMHLAREVLDTEVVERRITRDELYTADEAFVTGTAAEILPLRELDGRHIGALKGALAPDQPVAGDSFTAHIQALYHRVTRGDLQDDLTAYANWLTSAR
ncbi:branched-chain amino acid transaminase [Halomonas almeriensis]|uniref:branched-chain amino acid transaminase n=1 Tax=Halomonas almeriensis TaxID=308163 RepID=UPI0025B2ACCB|nr:branched-chain amino acid transaminase [Halomonas almeriensis]MDN3553786.1 branched-chain amino acid transaminase [Halomonas almeriensis]